MASKEPRHDMPVQDAKVRVTNFNEVALGTAQKRPSPKRSCCPALRKASLRRRLPGAC